MLLIGSCFCSSQMFAQSQTRIMQFEQEGRHQREQSLLDKQKQWLDKRSYQTESSKKGIENQSNECLPYSELLFRGVNAIDHRPLIIPKGSCLNEAKLNQLSRDLTAAYLKKGILHTPFQFETTLQNQLVMVVKEGRLRRLESDSRRLNFATLLPQMVGEILTVQDIDQALDQANKMKGSQVTVDVHPSSNGDIVLNFVNEEENRIQGSVGFNNFAAKHYHRWQLKGSMHIDSPFSLSDSLSLNMAHTLKEFAEYSRSVSFYHTIPYGYWSFNSFASFSHYRQILNLPNTEVEQKGRTVQGGISADYVINRGSNFMTTLSAQLERMDTKNRFADAVLLLQSPNLTAYQLSMNHLQLFPQGAVSVNVGYKHGLPWFNALSNQGKDQPEGQYGKWFSELYLQYYHRLSEQTFKQSHRLQGQYSRNYLVGSELADLTGRYAVRGLNDIGISAEKSLVLRNQLAWMQSWQEGYWSPYLALDLGVVKHSDSQASSQHALGYALGVSMERPKRWSALLEWASGKVKTEKIKPSFKSKNIDFSVELNF